LREGRGMGAKTIRLSNNVCQSVIRLYFGERRGPGMPGEKHPLNLIRVMPA